MIYDARTIEAAAEIAAFEGVMPEIVDRIRNLPSSPPADDVIEALATALCDVYHHGRLREQTPEAIAQFGKDAREVADWLSRYGVVLVWREPTEAMLDAVAGWPTHWPKEGPDFNAMHAAWLTDRLAATSNWRAMIDAALNRSTP